MRHLSSPEQAPLNFPIMRDIKGDRTLGTVVSCIRNSSTVGPKFDTLETVVALTIESWPKLWGQWHNSKSLVILASFCLHCLVIGSHDNDDYTIIIQIVKNKGFHGCCSLLVQLKTKGNQVTYYVWEILVNLDSVLVDNMNARPQEKFIWHTAAILSLSNYTNLLFYRELSEL